MSIKVSQKHGVNPTLCVCFYCRKDRGDLALLGRLPGDAEAPVRSVVDMAPCAECADWMEKGIILISAANGSEGDANPARTGGWIVLKEEAIREMLVNAQALMEHVLRVRYAFIVDEVWDALGLPRGEVKGSE